MIDKVQKIRKEVEKLHGNPYYMMAVKDVLEILDMQEEPAPKIFEDMLNAITPAESLGISAEEHEKIIDLCLYGKEPEMVDIDDLPKEEPVSIDFEHELYKAFGQVKDFTLGMRIAKWFYGMGKNSQEPVNEDLNTESMIESYKQRLISQANCMKNSPLIDVCLASYKHGINDTLDTLNLSNIQRTTKNWKEPVSEDLDKAALEYANKQLREAGVTDENCPRELAVAQASLMASGFKAGAKWQKEQMIAEAIDGKVIANGMCNPILHLWDKGRHLIGKKVKIIVIKED
jgi:hypothetical protein